MTLKYDPNQPVSSDTYAESQPDFLANFTSLYNAFKVNHIPLDAVSGAGNHTYVELLEQENKQETAVSEISVYTKDDKSTTDQLFLRYQGNGTEVPLTTYQLYSIKNPVGGADRQFFTFLPGRNIIYFGDITVSSGTLGVINLQPAVCINIVSVVLCAKSSIANQKPWVTLTGTPQGIFTAVNLNSRFGLGEEYFYIVWGNI